MGISKERKKLREQRAKDRELASKMSMREEVTVRKNGRLRIQYDYSSCPSKTDPSQARDTDINYLMERYKPDELANYIAARNMNRQEIVGHDFSQEPDLQGAKNAVYRMEQAFLELPEEIRRQFESPLAFFKFIDNPANEEKMLKMGILTKKQVDKVKAVDPTAAQSTVTSTGEAASINADAKDVPKGKDTKEANKK